MNPGTSFLIATLHVVNMVFSILQTLIFVWVILSWFILFTHQSSFRWRHRKLYDVIEMIYGMLSATFRPLLKPFRRLLPPHKTGGIDWSPLLLLLAISFLQVFFNSLTASLFRG